MKKWIILIISIYLYLPQDIYAQIVCDYDTSYNREGKISYVSITCIPPNAGNNFKYTDYKHFYISYHYNRIGEKTSVYVDYDSLQIDSNYSQGKLSHYSVTTDSTQHFTQFENDTLFIEDIDYYSPDTCNCPQNTYLSHYKQYHPNGKIWIEYYGKNYRKRGPLLTLFDADTVTYWYDNGLMAKQIFYRHNYKSYDYAKDGRLKMVYEVGNGIVSVKNYGVNGELLENGDFNSKGIGYLYYYDDNGILEEKAYYRRQKYIEKKSVKMK